jgi:hypothetical protein
MGLLKVKLTKSQLLEKYSRYEPLSFVQYLGFTDLPSSGVPASFKDVGEDENGHVLLMEGTCELMGGSIGLVIGSVPSIRVLVKEGTTKEEALALLAKITTWIEKDGIPC